MEIGSRGYVAKSFGFALQKLGLKQDSISKLRKAVSLNLHKVFVFDLSVSEK